MLQTMAPQYTGLKDRPWADVTKYGAVGDGSTDDTTAIQNALAASLRVFFPPGKTYNFSSSLNISANQQVEGYGAILSWTPAAGNAIVCNNINDWKLEGIALTGGSASNTAQGLLINGGSRGRVVNSLFGTIGAGVVIGSSGSQTRGQGHRFTNLQIAGCTFGFDAQAGNAFEYGSIVGGIITGCSTWGLHIAAGNWSVVSTNIVDCTGGGVLLDGGSNHGHGTFSSCNINHNSTYNVKFDSITNGYTFTGCNAYANDNTHGYIWFSNSKGCLWLGGMIDSPLSCDGTTGLNQIRAAIIAGTNPATIGGSNPEYLWLRDLHDFAGQWASQNGPECIRIGTTYTDAGNAGAGPDNLQQITIPARMLDSTSKTIRVRAWGRTANNANAKTINLLFGGTTIMTQALTVSIAGTWRIDATIVKNGANTQRIFAELLQLATIIHKHTATAGAVTDTAAIIVKCTASGVAANDVVQEGMEVYLS